MLDTYEPRKRAKALLRLVVSPPNPPFRRNPCRRFKKTKHSLRLNTPSCPEEGGEKKNTVRGVVHIRVSQPSAKFPCCVHMYTIPALDIEAAGASTRSPHASSESLVNRFCCSGSVRERKTVPTDTAVQMGAGFPRAAALCNSNV